MGFSLARFFYLEKYRSQFLEEGLQLALPTVQNNHTNGLLNQLPLPGPPLTGWPWTEQTNPQLYAQHTDWPKITIVTPSYNQGQFIEQTIRSVLLQNYPNLEYIVIDGGSTDQTVSILEKYSQWIGYWQSKKDRGQSHAINMGFSIASGQYHAWLNSDDYYLPGTLYKVANSFLNNKTEFVYGYGKTYNLDTQRYETLKMPRLFDYFIRIPTLLQPACFWSAAIHQPVWEELHCAMDYELWLRLVKGRHRKLIKEPLCVANVHTAAKTTNPAMQSVWQKDHELICAPGTHGPVPDWNLRIFLHRIYLLLLKKTGII